MKFTLSLAIALAAAAGIVFSATPAQSTTMALPFLDSMFTDNMVLQRGQSDPVWGWTTAGQTVTVSIAGKSAKAVAGTDGEWVAKLPALPAGGPYTMTVTGPLSTTLNNVLVGDVWVCSGQSNMQFGVGNLINPEKEIAAADYPRIRLFYVGDKIAIDPAATTVGTWKVCTPDNLKNDGDWGGFSAVAYFFGRDLYQDLHVPIGLIHSSWGGTPAEAWTSESALRSKMPVFGTALDQIDAQRALLNGSQANSRTEQIRRWYVQNDIGSRGSLTWSDPSIDDSGWSWMNLPGYFQQAGDSTLANINGVVWFRRTFDVPTNEFGKDLVLKLLADDNDTTWVNGMQVGQTEGFNVPRAYAIPASLLKPTGNLIAVRVLDTGGTGGIYGDAAGLCLQAPDGSSIPLSGPWLYKLGVDLTKATPYPVAVDNNPNAPTVLFNGMINPLIPYGIKGAVWYQGESNVDQAFQYRTLLPTMIGDWRARWGEANFPFLIVQLAAFGQPPAQPGDDEWAELQEAQWLTSRSVPNCGIATAIDIGDANNVHPKNKQELGRRLALVARHLVYHENVEDSGPIYSSITVSRGKITIHFTHIGGGLITQDALAPKGFAIAGSDRKWYWGDAHIVGDTIVVSSPNVTTPAAVRYAWAGGPTGNVASRDGLPMFPFRTDQFRLLTDRDHTKQ